MYYLGWGCPLVVLPSIAPISSTSCHSSHHLPQFPTVPNQVVQDQDGFFVRYLDSDLLRDVNVVDTPGTNVILDRQQRLTEEYVPRADLVLFVLSADRPFTDSEVRAAGWWVVCFYVLCVLMWLFVFVCCFF